MTRQAGSWVGKIQRCYVRQDEVLELDKTLFLGEIGQGSQLISLTLLKH